MLDGRWFSCTLSISACALLPWNAKELTPARCTCSRVLAAWMPTLAMANPHTSATLFAETTASTCGLRLRRCVKIPPESEATSLHARKTPDRPAPGSAWPTRLLIELAPRGRALEESTSSAAAVSIESPRAVPVPCISSDRTCSGARPPAAFMTREMTACCAGPFGAVSPLERPSWFAPQLEHHAAGARSVRELRLRIATSQTLERPHSART
mmetsp:Transcript_22270/g.72184  ORF Transcript_22270/g.72184 Transcript_22270/m.72184 type:complete len:212 (-) Transcript_22270:1284-1919(-)